jgi:uncharacterized protein
MKFVLADSSFWVALRGKRDVNHDSAQALATRMLRERVRLVVTPFIFAEVHDYFSRSQMLRETIIRDFWHNPVVVMEHLEPSDYQNSLNILQSHTDKDYPFCDVSSFTLMKRLGIKHALSFDDHFRQYGHFTVLD